MRMCMYKHGRQTSRREISQASIHDKELTRVIYKFIPTFGFISSYKGP